MGRKNGLGRENGSGFCELKGWIDSLNGLLGSWSEEELNRFFCLFQAVIDGLAEPLLIVDHSYRVRFLNKAARNMADLADPAKAPMCYQINHKFDRPCEVNGLSCPLRMVIDTKRPVKVVHKHERNGRTRWDEIIASPLFGNEHQLLGIVETIRDVTEREQAQDELRMKTRELETIFKNVPLGLVYLDSDLRILRVNPFLEKKMGIKDNEVRFKYCYDVLGKYARDPRKKGRERICEECSAVRSLQDGRIYVTEREAEKDYIVRITSVPIKDEDGETTGVLEIGEDLTDQKRAELELRRSEEMYRSLMNDVLDTSTVGIFVLDSSFRVVWLNTAMERFFGLQRSNVIGKDKTYLIEKYIKHIFEDPDGFATKVLATYEDNTYVENFECHVLPGPDREERWLEHWSQPITSGLYAGGRIEHYYDITGRKLAEGALEGQLQFLQDLLNTIPIPVFYKDISGVYLGCNKAFEEFISLPREQIVGKTINEIAPAKLAEIYHQKDLEILGSRQFQSYENLMELPDGTTCHTVINKAPFFKPDGTLGGIIGTILDVTKQKNAEKVARLAYAELNQIFETSGDGMCVIDTEANILRVNRRFGELFCVDPESLIGRKCYEVFDDADQLCNTPKCPLDRILKGEERVELDIEKRLENGRTIPCIVTATPLRDSEGNVAGVVEHFKDMSDRKVLEEQLRRAQRLEAVGKLAGGVAHDFNNLLTAIMGHTDLALMTLDKNDALYVNLKNVQKACERARDLVQQLLMFSRKQPLRFSRLNINKIIEDLLKMINRLIGEDVTVRLALEPTLFSIEADAGNIEQVIMNLVINARDAMPDGGEIIIKTENVILKKPGQDFPRSPAGRFVRLAISDTGIGMDEETLKRIFDPFFTTKGPGKGTGLGLAVVYGIIEQHHGWINVSSEHGKGSTFEVYLPALQLQDTLPDEKGDQGSVPFGIRGQGRRILVVEDEEVVCQLVSSVLREYGFEVFEARSAMEALEIFEQEEGRFDLVFSDLVLPDKSGVQLVEELMCRRPRLKALLGSGYTDEKIQLERLRGKGVPFIQKPYHLSELMKTIDETLRS